MVLSIASDLITRQIVWVNNQTQQSAPAYIWAALAREGKIWVTVWKVAQQDSKTTCRAVKINSVQSNEPQMFSATLTDSRSFGNTYQWAILSVLPMDSDKNQHGLNSPEIKNALGLSNAARTSLCLMMKEMAQKGLVRRYDLKIGNRRIVSYKRLLPLRKREQIARFLGVWQFVKLHTGTRNGALRSFIIQKSTAIKPMRKIESLMNAAIKASKDWKLDNTEVTNEGNISRVFLYDNQIATIGETWIQLFAQPKHQTATTKSRLNAILKEHGADGDYVFQKAGKWFVNYNGSTEPFSNGMKLA